VVEVPEDSGHVGPEAVAIRYPYVVSAVLCTWEVQSQVRSVRSEGARLWWGLFYCCVSLVCGWWAVPWGPWLTVRASWRSLQGGDEVTA
jgi:hypothetical protein